MDYLPHRAQVMYLRVLRRRMDFDTCIVGITVRLSYMLIAEWLEERPAVRSNKPLVRLSVGEIRAVLAMLERLGPDGMNDVAVLSGGTDGEDGPTDAAGAVVDGETWAKVTTAGLSVPDHLARHDAYPIFDQLNGLIRTGPTGTNVADVRVILVR